MKSLPLVLLVSLTAAPAFAASSICLVSIPNTLGSTTSVSCDGKTTNSFEVQDNWMSKQSALLQSLAVKGYHIVAESRNADSDQYTLEK